MTNNPGPDGDLKEVRQLWAGRFQGVLSTQSLADPGYPFGSVVPYCLDGAGQPLFLLSHLAQHCKNLDADPRCAFTIAEPTEGDVQQSLRLTCLGDCSPIPPQDAAAASRYFSYFPQGRVYFEELNFRFHRLTPRRFHFNGGFATARWLGTDRILRSSFPDPAQERQLRGEVEQRLPSVIRGLPDIGASSDEQTRIAGLDLWGLDLAAGDRLRRIPFSEPVESVADLLAQLGDQG